MLLLSVYTKHTFTHQYESLKIITFHIKKNILTDILRTVRDPEKPTTLEDLNVISEDFIYVEKPTDSNVHVVCIHKQFFSTSFNSFFLSNYLISFIIHFFVV